MSGADIADRYAEAHLQPTPEIIGVRQASVARIQEDADKKMLLDLIAAYYGMKPDLTWFRDELRKDDATFSLVTGERESVILAALVLAARIAESDPIAILGVVAGSFRGKRTPKEAAWLLAEALSALATDATRARVPQKLVMPVRHVTTPKLAQEIADPVESFEALGKLLGKVRVESQESTRLIAKQVTDALQALNSNARYQREESQILWWLFGEHSRTLDKPFSAFRPGEVALVGGIELGALTDSSGLGPVAAPAVLGRVLRGAKSEKAQRGTLLDAVDGLGADLASLIAPEPVHPGICPILTALAKASDVGKAGWVGAFEKTTGLEATLEFEPIELAMQVYLECLLGSAE